VPRSSSEAIGSSPLKHKQREEEGAGTSNGRQHKNDNINSSTNSTSGTNGSTTSTRGISGNSRKSRSSSVAVENHLKGISRYDRDYLDSARNLTGLQITFLGTSGGSPTLNRNVSSLALELNMHRSVNETWLFDCGEATQTRLMQSKLKITNVTKIFITHMHGDHIFGLPGVLCMMSNSRSKVIKELKDVNADRNQISKSWASQPVHIYGPPGIANFVTMSLALSESSLSIPLVVHEFSNQPSAGEDSESFTVTNRRLKNKIRVEKVLPDEKSLMIRKKIINIMNSGEPDKAKRYSWRKQSFSKNGTGRQQQNLLDKWECMRWYLDLYDANEAIEVVACPLKHRVDCWGYVIKEVDQPGKMDTDKVKALGLPRGPILKHLKNGEAVKCPTSGRWIKPEEVMGPDKPGRKVVILGDTSDNRWIAQDARGADVVVHEATFTDDMRQRALIAGHSTAGMAGNFAKYVDAGSLILNHFSARFEDSSQWESMKNNAKGRLKDLIAASKSEEIASIQTITKQAVAKFGKNSVFAAEDLTVYCIEKKDPHNAHVPSLVFPRDI